MLKKQFWGLIKKAYILVLHYAAHMFTALSLPCCLWNTFCFILGTLPLLNTGFWMGIGEQREEGRFFKKRRDFHCLQEAAKTCVCMCAFWAFLTSFQDSVSTSEFFFLHFLLCLLTANVNRWDPPNVRERD